MQIGSLLAIYFVAWWIIFVAVVPMGSTSLHEVGAEVEPGHEPGSPVKLQLIKKGLLTTVIAAFVTAGLIYLMTQTIVADYWNR
ncbi:DUF1467 family protein [Devosia sp. WQ 349]|uniref:DUF1467 family protein n=1 Tax=Devosia sp. WQ 349K1 TaxID=2800329 RepID=UPI001906DEA0|nr:DUF1467 family protein [Devosia sp. WQ 349K1]MBK1793140.1 DUF1467 family protein [Devosia sp. WQ 349K1]